MITLLSTGSNAHGQLGNNTLIDSHTFQPCSFLNHPPNSLPPDTLSVLNVVSGANHTLVLLELVDRLAGVGRIRRELWGCGDGRAGQLGGKRYNKELSGGGGATTTNKFRKIELCLDENGLSGYSYRLISASWETSYVVLSSSGKGDVVISMGSDEFGDLGVGGTVVGTNEKDFYVVRFDHLSASTPLGIHINPATLRVESITSGQRHTIVQIQQQQQQQQLSEPANSIPPPPPPPPPPPLVVGWGSSRHGQLGSFLGANQKLPPFTSLPQIIQVDDVVSSSALGIHHSLFLHSSGQLSALGSNRKGQLQLLSFPFNHQSVRKIGCTWNGSFAVIETEGGWRIYSSGSNTHGQMGRGKSDDDDDDDDIGVPGSSGFVHFPQGVLDCTKTSIEIIACGSEHVLVLSHHHNLEEDDDDDNGGSVLRQVLWGWGWNEHGNLGIGNTEDTRLPLKIWSNNEPGFDSFFEGQAREIMGIWAGAGTSWICCSLTGSGGEK